ncbi:unnamed protein product, partial [Staurois parvus]
HLATPPGSLNSSASSPVIGRRNCSSGEAHRRRITGEEVELGEEEPSDSAKIKEDRVRELPERVKGRRAAGEGRQMIGKCLYRMLAVDGRGRERAQAGAGVSKVSIIGVSG